MATSFRKTGSNRLALYPQSGPFSRRGGLQRPLALILADLRVGPVSRGRRRRLQRVRLPGGLETENHERDAGRGEVLAWNRPPGCSRFILARIMMPIRKAQTLLAALALALAVFTPLWQSSPHHGLPGEPGAHSTSDSGSRLASAGSRGSDAGGACPVCLYQRLLSQSCIEHVAAVSAPACAARQWPETELLPVSHRSLPPGARAPPAC